MNLTTVKLLITLKNAALFNKESVTVTHTKIIVPILEVLYKYNVIQSFQRSPIKNKIFIILKPLSNKLLFQKLKLISTSSRVRYVSYRDLCHLVSNPYIMFTLSTDLGYLSEYDCKVNKVGGKLLFIH
jgi:ribosomal protein S8